VVWWSAADRRHAVHDGVEMYVEIYLGVQTMAPRWANAMQLNREQRCPRVAQQAQAQAQAQRGVLCSALCLLGEPSRGIFRPSPSHMGTASHCTERVGTVGIKRRVDISQGTRVLHTVCHSRRSNVCKWCKCAAWRGGQGQGQGVWSGINRGRCKHPAAIAFRREACREE
jgi:hypothetical protein